MMLMAIPSEYTRKPGENNMNCSKTLKHAAFVIMLLATGVANAALLQFNLTGSYTASWQLDTSVKPIDVAQGLYATYGNVSGSFPGATQPGLYVTFYTPVLAGGFEVYDDNLDTALVATSGQQLYSGPESDPLFNLGTIALTGYDTPGTYLLTISEVATGAVPEPASAALLLGGLVLLSAFKRRQNR